MAMSQTLRRFRWSRLRWETGFYVYGYGWFTVWVWDAP